MNCEVCQLKELDVEHFQIREVLRCILHTILFHRALGLVRPKDIDLELFDITYSLARIKLYNFHENVLVSSSPCVTESTPTKVKPHYTIADLVGLNSLHNSWPSQVQCGDLELEKKVDEKIDLFIDRVEKHPNKKNQICMSFYEVKNKQATWFTNKVERLYWEQWYINLNVPQHQKAHSGKSYHSKVVVDPGESASEERNARREALEASLHEVMFQIIKFVNEKKDHVPPIPNLEGVSFPYEITISSSSDSAFGMDMFKRMLQTGHPTMLS